MSNCTTSAKEGVLLRLLWRRAMARTRLQAIYGFRGCVGHKHGHRPSALLARVHSCKELCDPLIL